MGEFLNATSCSCTNHHVMSHALTRGTAEFVGPVGRKGKHRDDRSDSPRRCIDSTRALDGALRAHGVHETQVLTEKLVGVMLNQLGESAVHQTSARSTRERERERERERAVSLYVQLLRSFTRQRKVSQRRVDIMINTQASAPELIISNEEIAKLVSNDLEVYHARWNSAVRPLGRVEGYMTIVTLTRTMRHV